jgi:hypothetical protein
MLDGVILEVNMLTVLAPSGRGRNQTLGFWMMRRVFYHRRCDSIRGKSRGIFFGFLIYLLETIWKGIHNLKVFCKGATTLSITTFSITPLNKMTFRIMTLSKRSLHVTLSISDTRHNDTQHNDIHHKDAQQNLLRCET